MKKIISLSLCVILALAISLSFTSCKKDGVYNPKQKISAIYYQYPGTAKMLREKWTWDGKLLSKIDYYYGGSYDYSDLYKYDGKRLIEVNSDGAKIKFTYDGSKLTKFEYFYEGNLEMSAKVIHEKGKITKIEFTEYYDDDYKKSEQQIKMFTALRGIVVPESTPENVADFYKKMKAKGVKSTELSTIEYTYDGKNVTEEKYFSEGYDEYTYTYKYDKEKNPFYNLLYGSESGGYEFSQNNVVTTLFTTSDGEVWEGESSYVYDGSYPVEEAVTYNGNFSGTYFYEYK